MRGRQKILLFIVVLQFCFVSVMATEQHLQDHGTKVNWFLVFSFVDVATVLLAMAIDATGKRRSEKVSPQYGLPEVRMVAAEENHRATQEPVKVMV